MRVQLLVGLAATALLGCQFDGSGLAPGDGGGNEDAGPDARPDPDSDAGPCPEPLHLELSVDGLTEPLGNGQPYVNVLVGDTVELSAEGSCSQAAGGLSYEWQVSPIDGTRTTAEPNLTTETITVYPVADQPYNVSLTIRDGGGRELTEQVFGFEAHAFRSLAGLPNDEPRDLDVGDGVLWIAAKGGAHVLSLDSPQNGFFELNNQAVGATIEDELQEVYYDADFDLVWFGHKDARGGLWQVDRGQSPTAVALINYDTVAALGAAAECEDISRVSDGLAAATKIGMTWSVNNVMFQGDFTPPDVAVHAVAGGGGRQWAGGAELYDMDAGGTTVDPFEGDLGETLSIRAMAVDEAADELWIGMDGNGIARLDLQTGALIAHYTKDSSGDALPADKVRDIAIETAGGSEGDVWIATDKGVARFKRDREAWLGFGNSLGLNGKLDVDAVVVDLGGARRGIWAGTRNGLVYLTAQ